MKINSGSVVLDTFLGPFYPDVEFYYQDPEIRSYLDLLGLKENGKGIRCVVRTHKLKLSDTTQVVLNFKIKTPEIIEIEIPFKKNESGFLFIDAFEELVEYGKACDLITARGSVHFYKDVKYPSRQLLKEELRKNIALATTLKEGISKELKERWALPQSPEETKPENKSSLWDEF